MAGSYGAATGRSSDASAVGVGWTPEVTMLFWIPVAAACDVSTPAPTFEGWLVDGVGIPTDARIVVVPGLPIDGLALTRVDTGEDVPVGDPELIYAYTGARRVYAPAAALAADTEYHVALSGPDGLFAETTFTTSSGPADTAVDAPIVDAITASAWVDEDGACESGSARTLDVELTLPAALEPGTYLALSSPGMPEQPEQDEWFLPADGTSIVVSQHAFGTVGRADRECLTPRLVLPSGAEVVGDEVCAPSGVEAALGCAHAPASAAWAATLLLAAVARSRRRR
jgi:hypothetical protein